MGEGGLPEQIKAVSYPASVGDKKKKTLRTTLMERELEKK